MYRIPVAAGIEKALMVNVRAFFMLYFFMGEVRLR